MPPRTLRVRHPLLAFAVLAVCSVPAADHAAERRGAGERGSFPAGQATYEGALDVIGHYAKPGDTRRYETTLQSYSDGRGNVRLEWSWREGESLQAPESFLVAGTRVFHRSRPGAPWSEYAGMEAEQGRLQATAAFLRTRRGGVPESTVVPRAHPRLGDVRDRVVFTYPARDSVTLTMTMHERHHEWTLHARLVSEGALTAPDSLFAVPAAFEPARTNPDSLSGSAVLGQVADGIWTVDMDDVDSRSLVVEFADHLALIEIALSSANGERIVDTLKRKWPSKPVRYVLFSHHHPHYLGGIRAAIAEGATVVTTPGNDPYVRKIAGYKYSLAPDRLARAPRPVQVLPFPSRLELSDSTNRLVAFNIGKKSNHTDEFVLYWMPRQRILFEAEQGWVTVNDTLRASRRASTLLEIVKEEQMDVDRLIQSWPMRGEPGIVSMRDLQALVAKRK